ncbi:MAG TPA: hypothetical protein VFV38_47270 [Ktedonobacteraceae bacterium]|nr:hypothetical protein [Ktedonobacteraceae bacterium]
MTNCVICRKQFSFFENLTNRAIQRCKACDQRLKQVQREMMAFVESQWQQQGVFPQTRQHVSEQFVQLQMPADLGTPVMQRIEYLIQLTDIRYGNIPRTATSIHLDSDEYAHFEFRCVYFKPNKTIKEIPGRLVGTNKKCYFLSDSGSDSATIDWNNVSQTYQQTLQVTQTFKKNGQKYTKTQAHQTLHVTVSRGSGGGDYEVDDILYTKTLMDTLVGQLAIELQTGEGSERLRKNREQGETLCTTHTTTPIRPSLRRQSHLMTVRLLAIA